MANIAVTDVTHLVLKRRKGLSGRKSNLVRLSFGDSSLTYPASGIPLSKGKMGCPNNIESMTIVDVGTSAYQFMYDQSAEKLIVLNPSHTHDMKYIGGITATEPVAIQTGDTLGKNAATDRTIVGSSSATKGGVVAVAALAEASALAIAAQVIEVEVIGW